jgi:hypothetical protein
MPEAPSDIDYTVDMGRHETMFRANTPKGEEFLGGGDLTMSNEGCPRSRADGQIVFLTASKTDPAPRYWSKGEVIGYKRARLQQLVQRRPLNGNPRDAVALEQRKTLTAGNVGALMMSTERPLPWRSVSEVTAQGGDVLSTPISGPWRNSATGPLRANRRHRVSTPLANFLSENSAFKRKGQSEHNFSCWRAFRRLSTPFLRTLADE